MADKKESAASVAASQPPVKAGGKGTAKKVPSSASLKDAKGTAKKVPSSASLKDAKAKKTSRMRVIKLEDGKVVKKRKGKRSFMAKKKRREAREAKTGKKRPADDSKDGAAKDAPKPKKIRRPHRLIASGVARFSRPYKYHKRGAWKFVPRKVKKATPKKPRMVKKEIGGDKNGGFRMVLLKKRRQSYPTCDPMRKKRCRGVFKKHKRYIRSSLKPGTICILLAGRHRGKRVVLMKVLNSGLLLVNGPHSINKCPLRRVSQNYVIATHTRLNLKGEKIPKHINDEYFKRIRAAKKAKKEGDDIFTTKKEKYIPSAQRQEDQKEMDRAVMRAIKKYGRAQHRMKKMTIRYLSGMFGLKRNQKPHVMKF